MQDMSLTSFSLQILCLSRRDGIGEETSSKTFQDFPDSLPTTGHLHLLSINHQLDIPVGDNGEKDKRGSEEDGGGGGGGSERSFP